MKVSHRILSTSHKGKLSSYRSFLRHTYHFYKYLAKFLRKSTSKDKIFFFLLDKEEQQKHYQRILNSYNKSVRNKMSGNYNHSEYNDESVSSFIMNKIMGAYKTTKESPYVRSIYQETSSVFNNQGATPNSLNEFVDALPENTHITLYPNYCKHDNGEYVTRVKGIVTATGIVSRKNRFLLSMARRISKLNDANSVDQSQFENDLQDAITNQDNYKYKDDDSSISSSSVTLPNDTVKTRMEGILAKTIPGTSLNITIGSEEPVDQLSGAKLTTDNFGIFDVSIVTPYKPSYVAASSAIDPSILQTTTLEIIEARGVSVITDIDDTIRLTGVLGDKREVFRNIFSKPYSSCEVTGVAEWFKELHDVYKCPIHYVSNSPWQVFNVVQGFMSYFEFPVSSIHLRQYSGNLLASFTQPSAERKRPSLVTLLEDFPERKFVLVGDTGEQDLEAYLSLIPRYAPQILAIYLRVVPTSLSSLGNDAKVLKELRKMIAQRNTKRAPTRKLKVDNFLRNPTGIDSDDSDYEFSVASRSWVNNTKAANEGQNTAGPKHSRRRSSIDLAKNTINTAVNITKVKKLAPIVPRKPVNLRGTKILKIDGVVSPKTGQAPNQATDISPKEPLMADVDCDDYMEFSDDEFDGETLDANGILVEDKKYGLWKQKVRRIIEEVPEHIQVKFWEDVQSVRDDSEKLITYELK